MHWSALINETMKIRYNWISLWVGVECHNCPGISVVGIALELLGKVWALGFWCVNPFPGKI